MGSDIMALTTTGALTCSADSLALFGFGKKKEKQRSGVSGRIFLDRVKENGDMVTLGDGG